MPRNPEKVLHQGGDSGHTTYSGLPHDWVDPFTARPVMYQPLVRTRAGFCDSCGAQVDDGGHCKGCSD